MSSLGSGERRFQAEGTAAAKTYSRRMPGKLESPRQGGNAPTVAPHIMPKTSRYELLCSGQALNKNGRTGPTVLALSQGGRPRGHLGPKPFLVNFKELNQ